MAYPTADALFLGGSILITGIAIFFLWWNAERKNYADRNKQ